jgi:hypothetical protein
MGFSAAACCSGVFTTPGISTSGTWNGSELHPPIIIAKMRRIIKFFKIFPHKDFKNIGHGVDEIL